MLKVEKPAIPTQVVLSLSFDDGVVTIATAHAVPLSLRSALAYRLTREEARELAAELRAWADS
jgi:hypothetical protein